MIVLGGLLLNGTQTATNLFEQPETESTVDRWLLGDSLHTRVNVYVDGNDVTAVIVRPSAGLGDVDLLATEPANALGRTITVDVRLIVEERFTATGN